MALSKNKKFPIVGLLIFAFIVVADAVSTYFLVTAGYATEANPMLNWMIEVNWVYFFLFKCSFLGLFILLVYRAHFKKAIQGIERYVYSGLVAYTSIYLFGIVSQIIIVI